MMQSRLLKLGSVILFILVFAATMIQGIVSSYRLYPSALPGYQVQAFDSTPRWAGTRALVLQGINPYSSQGDAIIQTQYFGRPLQPGDKQYAGDQQKFAYPLYVALLYLPTIFTDFSTALIVLLISFYVSFIAGVWFWFRHLSFPTRKRGMLLLLTLCLTLPEAYLGFQSRQPALWVFFFLSASICLISRGKPMSDALAGFLLVWSTIKPQSSILVILYIVFIVIVLGRGIRKSLWFTLGFGGTGLALLGITWLMLPGWVFDFLDAARDYRNYAGNTGAESVFGTNSIVAIITSVIGVVLWLAIMWHAHKQAARSHFHNLALAYSMALPVLIFPAHLYNFIFVIPLLLLALKGVWGHRLDGATVIVLILMLLTLYFAYLYWLGILSEGFGGTIGALALTIRRLLPGGIYYFTITAMLLGPALLWVMRRAQHTEQMA